MYWLIDRPKHKLTFYEQTAYTIDLKFIGCTHNTFVNQCLNFGEDLLSQTKATVC